MQRDRQKRDTTIQACAKHHETEYANRMAEALTVRM